MPESFRSRKEPEKTCSPTSSLIWKHWSCTIRGRSSAQAYFSDTGPVLVSFCCVVCRLICIVFWKLLLLYVIFRSCIFIFDLVACCLWIMFAIKKNKQLCLCSSLKCYKVLSHSLSHLFVMKITFCSYTWGSWIEAQTALLFWHVLASVHSQTQLP